MSSRVGPTLGKGLYGTATRLAQALLLLVVVVDFTDEVQSDVAVVLTAAVAVNLISNFGLPTALLRRLSAGDDRTPEIGILVRAYVWTTVLGLFLAAAVTGAVTGSWVAALAAAALLLSMSLTGLLEYWALGRDDYVAFLKRAAPYHAVLGFAAAPVVLVADDAWVGLFLLAAAGVAPLAASWSRAALRDALRQARDARLRRADPALRDAARVGVATAAAAVLYGADVFLLRLTGNVGDDAAYRLAIMGVSFAIGLVPAGFFALAHSAKGGSLRWTGATAGYVAATIAVCLTGGLVASRFDDSLGEAGRLLLLLAPLAAIRLATQVVAAHQHGRGEHAQVAILFATGACAFLAAGLVGALLVGVHGLMGAQLLTEALLLGGFLYREHAATGAPALVDTPRA